MEPSETRPTRMDWISFPAQVMPNQSFTVRAMIYDLLCAEWGELAYNQSAGAELVIEFEWRDIRRSDAVCDDPGGGPFFTNAVIHGIPGPAGRTLPVNSGEHTFGTIQVVASAAAGTRAGGSAFVYRDIFGCDRINPLYSSLVFGSHVLGDPPPVALPQQKVFFTGYLERPAAPVCGDTVVFRILTP
jgi:hypothetical protein